MIVFWALPYQPKQLSFLHTHTPPLFLCHLFKRFLTPSPSSIVSYTSLSISVCEDMSGGETVGFSEGFLWENQSWANLSINSDNSVGAGDEDKNLGNKEETAVMGISTEGHNQVPPAPGKKRRGGGGVGKNGIIKGSTSPADKGKGSTGAGDGGGGGGESDDHEMHIWTERERRKKMRNMFANLHALLPQLPPKVITITIYS